MTRTRYNTTHMVCL